MGNVALKTASGGSVILSPTNTAVDTTITVPASNATMAINGPAFSAYLNISQSVTANTFTKVQCNIEEFDTAAAYDNATNYRFQPSIAGYYQINGNVSASGAAVSRLIAILYKNGVSYKNGFDVSGTPNKGGVSSLVYLNGSTDYVELYGYISGTSVVFFGNSDIANTWFNGSMVRSAI